MCDLHSSRVMAVFVGEKPAIDEFIKNWLRHIRPGKRIVESATVAMAARGKEFVLHESSNADGKSLSVRR